MCVYCVFLFPTAEFAIRISTFIFIVAKTSTSPLNKYKYTCTNFLVLHSFRAHAE